MITFNLLTTFWSAVNEYEIIIYSINIMKIGLTIWIYTPNLLLHF